MLNIAVLLMHIIILVVYTNACPQPCFVCVKKKNILKSIKGLHVFIQKYNFRCRQRLKTMKKYDIAVYNITNCHNHSGTKVLKLDKIKKYKIVVEHMHYCQ